MNTAKTIQSTAQPTSYDTEVREKWGNTAAYKEYEARSQKHSKENQDEINMGMHRLMAEFAACKTKGIAPHDTSVQALVKQWQEYITTCYYACTKEILKGLGAMYIADERFRHNIDQHGEGTAQFMHDAICAYCK